MAAVYTKCLVEIFNPAPSVLTDLGTAPVGTKWVIKHMVASVGGAGGGYLAGFRVADTAQVILWHLAFPWILTGLSYNWEGTQALETGQHLFILALDSGWSLRVTGHELTLP
jgi:hypothetical protein